VVFTATASQPAQRAHFIFFLRHVTVSSVPCALLEN
jgi:hypothetical protein